MESSLLKKENLTGSDTFLKVGLFDIWLCNEDRHFENFNLLYDLKSNAFVPIDHVFCFNSNNIDKDPYLISSNESILSSPFLNRFFVRTLQPELNKIRLRISKDFKINVNRCHEELDNILSQIPLAWEADYSYLKTRLEIMFAEQWLKSCLDYFTELLVLNIKTQKK
ncbi:MAG: hypothetical protein A2X08_04280 [Bacteroidetes bacterium GWA2_32_17]|nr:MAG: hypothetical protein A2X08_04280 [Bacteroidetes bacterium GWA2_32_17]